MELSRLFGYNVKRARTERFMSQASLAKAMGVSRSYINRLELGQKNPTFDVLARLSTSLHIKVHELLTTPTGHSKTCAGFGLCECGYEELAGEAKDEKISSPSNLHK